NCGTPPHPPPAALTAPIASPTARPPVSSTPFPYTTLFRSTAPYTYALALDGTTLVSGAATGYAWNTTATNDASHTLTLTVQDGAGATANARPPVTVTNRMPPPAPGTLRIAITEPTNGTTVS